MERLRRRRRGAGQVRSFWFRDIKAARRGCCAGAGLHVRRSSQVCPGLRVWDLWRRGRCRRRSGQVQGTLPIQGAGVADGAAAAAALRWRQGRHCRRDPRVGALSGCVWCCLTRRGVRQRILLQHCHFGSRSRDRGAGQPKGSISQGGGASAHQEGSAAVSWCGPPAASRSFGRHRSSSWSHCWFAHFPCGIILRERLRRRRQSVGRPRGLCLRNLHHWRVLVDVRRERISLHNPRVSSVQPHVRRLNSLEPASIDEADRHPRSGLHKLHDAPFPSIQALGREAV